MLYSMTVCFISPVALGCMVTAFWQSSDGTSPSVQPLTP